MRVYCILQSLSKRTSHLERPYHLGYLDIFPPGPGQLSSHFSLAYASPPPPSQHFTSVSTFDFFLPFPFFCLYHLLFSPSCTSGGTSPPIPLHFSLVPRYYIPFPPSPSQFQYYLLFHCSSLLTWFLFVSFPSVHIIMFLLSPHCAHGNLTME